jgi:hypothetical protein
VGNALSRGDEDGQRHVIFKSAIGNRKSPGEFKRLQRIQHDAAANDD